MKKICFIFLSVLAFSCSKIEIIEPEKVEDPKATTADFTIDKSVVYLTENIHVMPADTGGLAKNYQFDFGDGTKISQKWDIVHAYSKSGNFKITLKVDNHSSEREIKVNPGYLSYQIQNASSVKIDMLSYLENYKSGTLMREEFEPNDRSDTLYTTYKSNENFYRFYASFFYKNKEYIIDQSEEEILFKPFTHNVFIINDSTKIKLKNEPSESNDSLRYIVDFR